MGVLNAHQKFLLPALAPTMYWLGMIFGVLFLTPSMGIHGLAWGAVLGAGGHLAVQFPGILRLKERHYHLTLGLDNPAVRRVGALLGPRLFGVAVVQLNFWVNTILASGQPVGSLTAIQIAFAVMTMPQVVIAQAIAIAALPTFSAQAARGNLDEMRASLAATLRGVILLSLPASLGLILLRFPIVALLFERGEFDAHSTSLVAWALLWYGAGLVGHSVVEVVSRAFYALHDTKTPVVVGVIAMSLNVAFSIAFAAWFAQTGLPPHGGLALGNSLATALEMVALLALMARRLDGLEGRNIWVGGLQAGAATLGMSLALLGWLNATAGASVWLLGLGGIAVGGLAYAILIYAQRVPEARDLMRFALGRLNRMRA
jgi:putative peptidoglycan lipid II flippase